MSNQLSSQNLPNKRQTNTTPETMGVSSDSPESFPESPLWMVTQQPVLLGLVKKLQDLREEIVTGQTGPHPLPFSHQELDQARQAFARMILNGERELHRLSQLICEAFASDYHLKSVVIGEIDDSKERFTLIKDISVTDLYTTTDLDLGRRQLDKLRFHVGENWSQASLVANMVDYQLTQSNEYNIHRLISRIKAEEEIWNKVVDEIFGLDEIVKSDKQLHHQYSHYVKDIFGIKIVVGEQADAPQVQNRLKTLQWTAETLAKVSIELTSYTENLDFVEEKDYLSGHRKQSGWEAIKSVVHWNNKTFEIQVQPLRNFLRERELLTKESHTGFKANREQAREQVAKRDPLFKYCRDLLRWLFLTDKKDPPPEYPNVKLEINE